MNKTELLKAILILKGQVQDGLIGANYMPEQDEEIEVAIRTLENLLKKEIADDQEVGA